MGPGQVRCHMLKRVKWVLAMCIAGANALKQVELCSKRGGTEGGTRTGALERSIPNRDRARCHATPVLISGLKASFIIRLTSDCDPRFPKEAGKSRRSGGS